MDNIVVHHRREIGAGESRERADNILQEGYKRLIASHGLRLNRKEREVAVELHGPDKTEYAKWKIQGLRRQEPGYLTCIVHFHSWLVS
jgi:hypothetical protein